MASTQSPPAFRAFPPCMRQRPLAIAGPHLGRLVAFANYCQRRAVRSHAASASLATLTPNSYLLNREQRGNGDRLRQAFVLPLIAPSLSNHESEEEVTKWRVLRGLGRNASMREVLLAIMLLVVASVLLSMLWRQFKRQVILRRADRISRTIGDVGVATGDRHLKQLLAAYRLARAKSHLDAGAFLYPAAEALVSEFRMRQLERGKEKETWRSLTPH